MADWARLDIAEWPDGAKVCRLDLAGKYDDDQYATLYFAYTDCEHFSDGWSSLDGTFAHATFEAVPIQQFLSGDQLRGNFSWTNTGQARDADTAEKRLRWTMMATARAGAFDRSVGPNSNLLTELVVPRGLPPGFVECLGPGSRVEQAVAAERGVILDRTTDRRWPHHRTNPMPDLVGLMEEACWKVNGWGFRVVDGYAGRKVGFTFETLDPSGQRSGEFQLEVGDLRYDKASRSLAVGRWYAAGHRQDALCQVTMDFGSPASAIGVGPTPWDALSMPGCFYPVGQRAVWEERWLDPGRILIPPDDLEVYWLLGQWHPCWWPPPAFREYAQL